MSALSRFVRSSHPPLNTADGPVTAAAPVPAYGPHPPRPGCPASPTRVDPSAPWRSKPAASAAAPIPARHLPAPTSGPSSRQLYDEAISSAPATAPVPDRAANPRRTSATRRQHADVDAAARATARPPARECRGGGESDSAAMRAAEEGDVRKLRGFDPAVLAAQDTFGWTTLHSAAAAGRPESVRFLLGPAGMGVAARRTRDARGLTAAQIAALSGHPGIAAMLAEHEAQASAAAAAPVGPGRGIAVDSDGESLDLSDTATICGSDVDSDDPDCDVAAPPDTDRGAARPAPGVVGDQIDDAHDAGDDVDSDSGGNPMLLAAIADLDDDLNTSRHTSPRTPADAAAAADGAADGARGRASDRSPVASTVSPQVVAAELLAEALKLSSQNAAAATPTAAQRRGQQSRFCEQCGVVYEADRAVHVSSIGHQLAVARPAGGGQQHGRKYKLSNSNVGYRMMLSAGWNDAAGLGPTGEGRPQPVKTLLKNDRAGVGMRRGSTTKKVTHFSAFDAAAVKKRHRAGGKTGSADGDGDGDAGTARTTVGASHMQYEQRREKRIKHILDGPSYPGPNDA